jgi:hypothetical protein
VLPLGELADGGDAQFHTAARTAGLARNGRGGRASCCGAAAAERMFDGKM